MLAKAQPQNGHGGRHLSSIPDSNRGVYLYAAPNDTSLNNAITAKITIIFYDNACKGEGAAISVTVTLYNAGTPLGQVTYAHLERSTSLAEGQSVPRWGTYLGAAVGLPKNNDCWTGPHVHLELGAAKHYACWNKGFTWKYRVDRTNFVGFVSGSFLHSNAGSSSAWC